MTAMRQDAWTEKDDFILTEVTLRHIREGGTQLSAFAEVGQQIGRTQAACGFRWNSYLRKQYAQEIKQAKAQRQKVQHERRKFSVRQRAVEGARFAGGATEVRASYGTMADSHTLREFQQQLQQSLHLVKELQNDWTMIVGELEMLRKENEDYKNLLQIIERARLASVQTSGHASESFQEALHAHA